MPTSPGNADLARLFAQIAQMLELTGADRFRTMAHDRAARIVADAGEDLLAIAENEDAKARLTAIEGIGSKIADKIIEFATTGKMSEHRQLLDQVPPGLLRLLEIPGLGPKTVRAMWESAGVESIDDLKRIIADGSIKGVPRMGAKTIGNISDAIAFAEKAGTRTSIGIALPIAEGILGDLKDVKSVTQAQYAGSLRRGRETIGDVDLLVASDDPTAVREAFTSIEGVEKVLAAGETKSSVRLQSGSIHLQADLRIVPAQSYGAALMYFTGSKEHNVRLRERALKMGYTLNEYGLYPHDDEPTPPQQRGVAPVAGRTEREVYEALKMPFVPPELREDRDLDALAPTGPDADLIEQADVKAELHAHTVASDGSMSIQQLARAAAAQGFHTIAVTDHSQSSPIAGGLRPDDLRRHIDRIHEADSNIKEITILAGSEVDSHADGSLDYDDDLLALLDVVVVSPHAALRQDPKAATQRLLRAVTHPLVHILGHPTGRLIGRREGLSPDLAEIAAAAAEHQTALEINSHWRRLDLRDAHVRLAMGCGALIAIDCDVHAQADFENLRYGVLTARRGGLTARQCVNTWSRTKLHAWLKSKR